jgi:hypothetical protein
VLVEQPRQRTNDGDPVPPCRQLRHQLADFKARHVRRNRREFASNLLGRAGLEVEHVLMRRTTVQEDVDDRLAFAGRAPRVGTKQVADGNAPDRQSAKAQRSST